MHSNSVGGCALVRPIFLGGSYADPDPGGPLPSGAFSQKQLFLASGRSHGARIWWVGVVRSDFYGILIPRSQWGWGLSRCGTFSQKWQVARCSNSVSDCGLVQLRFLKGVLRVPDLNRSPPQGGVFSEKVLYKTNNEWF